MKIKKGDNCIVIAGKDKGKTGKVILAFPSRNLVIVDGVNMKKKHQKPKQSGKHGAIIDKTAPIHVSNVMFIDPKTGKRTRLGSKVVGEKRVRYAKKSGAVV